MPDRCWRRSRAPIGPDETSVEVERGLAELGARTAASTSWIGWRTDRVVETPQDDSARDLRAEARRRPRVPSTGRCRRAMIHNRVRGLQPWPMASTTIDGAAC